MPAQYYSGGGLRINPTITTAPVDPIEQALRQAQLYNLQQDPKFRERALTLQQLGLEHNAANDEAIRRIQEAGLLEQTRHNTATEKVATGQLGEETRHNVVGEGLTARGQDITATDSANQQKTAVTTALIHTMLGNLDTNDPEHHIAAETLAKLGYPQLKESLGAAKPADNSAVALEALKRLGTDKSVAPERPSALKKLIMKMYGSPQYTG